MSPCIVDIRGQRFGHWVVLKLDAKRHRSGNHCLARWICRCTACGTQRSVIGTNLRIGSSTSCGCTRHESAVKHGHARVGKRSRLYGIWNSMKQRCNNPRNAGYHYYGARGIHCDDWHHFVDFLGDMGEPGPGESLDRIDVDGQYTKRNCRWATKSVQRANQRRRHRKTKTKRAAITPSRYQEPPPFP